MFHMSHHGTRNTPVGLYQSQVGTVINQTPAAGGDHCHGPWDRRTGRLRPMLLGAGLCSAGLARAAAGAAAYAGPGRAVAGGVRWDVRGACAGGVGARPRRGYVAGFRKGAAAAGIRGGGRRVGGRMLAGR